MLSLKWQILDKEICWHLSRGYLFIAILYKKSPKPVGIVTTDTERDGVYSRRVESAAHPVRTRTHKGISGSMAEAAAPSVPMCPPGPPATVGLLTVHALPICSNGAEPLTRASAPLSFLCSALYHG